MKPAEAGLKGSVKCRDMSPCNFDIADNKKPARGGDWRTIYFLKTDSAAHKSFR